MKFPFQLRVLGWRSGGSQLPRWTLGPFGLNVCLLPSAHEQLVSARETEAEGEQQGFGIVHRPCGMQAAAQELCSVPWTAQQKSDPKSLPRGGQDYRQFPWALLIRALGSRFPRMSPTWGP